MSKQFYQYNAPVYNNSTVYNAPVTINNYDSRPSSGLTEYRPNQHKLYLFGRYDYYGPR